jgi:hypothetical protein
VTHPDIVEKLFSALHECQTGIFGDKAEAQARYEVILEEVMTELGLSRETILRGLQPRYQDWVGRNRLPRPPKE